MKFSTLSRMPKTNSLKVLAVSCMAILLSLASLVSNAQFNTVAVNGSIGTNEYGTHTDGQNQNTNGGFATLMSWDNTNLYVGISAASGNNSGEGIVIYLDKDNLTPIDGGTAASNGTNVGNTYDGTNFAQLPFRADLVVYVKDGYNEYRTPNGSNGWSGATTNTLGYSASNGTVMEVAIPWSAIGGRPASFNFFSYKTSGSGFVYAQQPTVNAGGNIGTSARYSYYYTVSSTADGSSTKPFSRLSYVFNSTTNLTGFGAIGVWDFTMNSGGGGTSITRAAGAGGVWTISGNLVVASGTIDFGSSSNAANVGNVVMSGGALTLSTATDGDLNISGNFTKTGGTFNCNSRAVGFNGNTKQIFSSNATENINFLSVTNTTDSLVLASNVNIPAPATSATTISFSNGSKLQVRPGVSLTVNSSGTILGNVNLGGTNSRMNVQGTFRNTGTTNANTFTNVTATTLIIDNGGTFDHNTAAGGIVTATWSTGSTCLVSGVTGTVPTVSTLTQNFHHFTWNCLSQTGNLNLSGNLSTVNGNFTVSATNTGSLRFTGNTALTMNVGGNFNVNGGTLYAVTGTSAAIINITGNLNIAGGIFDINNGGSGTQTINLTGNFSQTGGTFTRTNGSASNINFNKVTGVQTISQSAGTISGTNNWNASATGGSDTLRLSTSVALGAATMAISSPNLIDLGINVLSGTGTFSLGSGAGLITANTGGVNSSITTTTRTLNAGGNYIFNGTTGAQFTGAALTAANNMQINNSAGLSLSSNTTITGTLTFTNGKLTTNGKTLTLSNTPSGATTVRYIVTDATGTVTMNAVTTAKTLPIGTSGSYAPLTITAPSSTNYTAYVSSSLPCTPFNSAKAVNLAWVLGGSTAPSSVGFQWNSGDQGGSFTSNGTMELGRYNASCPYVVTTLGTAAGTDPNTVTASSGFATGTNTYVLANQNALVLNAPTVTTTVAASAITDNSAASGGQGITGSTIDSVGLVWSVAPATPAVGAGNYAGNTNEGTSTANFSSNLSGLSAETQYNVRAYASNPAGTGYGNTVSFYTWSSPVTAQATGFSASAVSGSQIDLNWTGATFPGSGATAKGYVLLRATSPNTPSLSNGNGAAPAAGANTTIVSATIAENASTFSNTGLISNTTYNYLLVPFTWDGTNAATYNYLTSGAPTANATTNAGAPSIASTTAITSISNTSASSGGSTITDGGTSISSKGVVWDVTTAPTTISNAGSTNDGTGTTDFSSSLSGLNPQTLYYVRAYVDNGQQAYANELSFRTLSNPATAQASGFSATASSSGTLSLNWTGASFPGSGATEAGYVLLYAASPNTPSLSNGNGAAPSAGPNTTIVSTSATALPSTPSVSASVSGLTGGTTYNFLLVPYTWDGTNASTYNYLTGGAPTASATAITTASVSTVAATSITINGATSGGNSINAGGGTISARGVVWDITANPTISSNLGSTNDGTGISSYSSTISGLNPETQYNYRAYVTNELGVTYGSNLTFRTLSNEPTSQASNLTGAGTSTTNINLSWTAATFAGSGATASGYVLLRATSPNTPSLGNGDGAAPTAGASTTIISSTIGSGATSTSDATGTAGTTYNYLLVPYSWDGTNASTYNYLTTGAPTTSASTLATAPANSPTAIVFSGVTSSTITTSWTAATGSPAATGYIVLRGAGVAPNTDPVPGTTYTAGNTLGNATVAYVGAAVTTGSQTGLADGTTYNYKIYSYSGSGATINYKLTSPLTGSQATINLSAPVATAATAISTSGFTANWNPVSGAGSYELDVFTLGASTTNVVSWNFPNNPDNNIADGGIAANTSQTLTTQGSVSGTISYTPVQSSTTSAASLSGWDGGSGTKCWQVDFNTVGYYNITVSSAQRSSNTGPRDFKLQYRIGTTGAWTDVSGATVTVGNDWTSGVLSNVTLPGECANRTQVFLRWIMTSNTNVSNATVASGGTSGIDNIAVNGIAGTIVSGYNALSVAGTSQSVTGLNASTLYGYVVRAVGSNASANSNLIQVTTFNDINFADFRSKANGNWSDANTWEYLQTGVTWVAATQAPGSGNNVSVLAAHTVALDQAHTVGSGKAVTVSGTLNTGSNVISGAGTFTLASAATLGIGSVDGISSSGATGNVQTTTRNFNTVANYVYNGTASQVTGSGLPATVSTLTINNSGTNPDDVVTLSNAVSISSTTNSLRLQAGRFDLNNLSVSIPNNGTVASSGGNFTATAGPVAFLGAATVSGTVTFPTTTIAGGVNFGTASTIATSLQVNTGGFCATNSPAYASGATLVYNTGQDAASAYGTFNEWPATNGPTNVTLNGNTYIRLQSDLSLSGNLTINSGSGLRSSSGLKTLTLTGGSLLTPATFTNSGTMFGEYAGNTLGLTFNGVTQLAGTTGYLDAKTYNINGTLICGNIGLNSNSASPAAGQVFINSGAALKTSNLNGLWDGSTANPTIRYNGTAMLAPSINSNSTVDYNNASGGQAVSALSYGNLVFSNASGNNTLAGNASAVTVDLGAGTLTTGASTLSVTSGGTGAVTRTTGYVIGNLNRAISTGTNSYAYPVGTGSGYTPAVISLNGVTTGGSITATTLNGVSANYPSALSATDRLARHWTITNNGVAGFTADVQFDYLATDLTGAATSSSIKAYKFDAPSTVSYPSYSTAANSFTVTGITSFNEFGAGDCVTSAISSVTGISPLCIGATDTYVANGVVLGSGTGAWSSDNTGVATVDQNTGLVTALAAGTANITYTISGGCSPTVSASQSVTVNPNVNAGTVSGTPAICAGDTYTFTSDGDSGGTWSSDNTGVATVNPTTGLVTAIGAGTANITYTVNGCNGPSTASAGITVNPILNVSVSISATPGNAVCTGTSVTFQALPANGGTSPTYQWYLNNNPLSGETGNSYTTSTLAQGDQVYVVLTSNASPCATGSPATSNTITMTIYQPVAVPGPISGPLDVCAYTNTNVPITYSISAVPGAASYIWAVPNGATIVSGQGTTSIDVLIGSSFASTNQQFKVRSVSPEGCISNSSNLVVTKTIPAIPAQIFGPVNVCAYVGQPTTATYSINPVSGATNYFWEVGTGMTIVSGQGTTSVEVSFAGTFTFAGIRVTAQSNCGNRSPRSLSLSKTAPASPSAITGPTNVCAFVGQPGTATYTISAVSGASSYLWTPPANATIVNGQGTTSVDVSFASGYTPGTLKVRAVAACGSSADQSLPVGVGIPAVPGTISGPTSACSYIGTNTQVSYTISPVSGATSYTWTVPAGMTVINGQGSNNLTVTFGGAFTTADIKVKSVSACGSSADATLTITAATATAPGVISGPNNACLYIGTANVATYTIRKVANATGYIWTAPVGMTITGHPAGTGVNDTIVTATFDNSFVNGTSLQVQSVNCNTSAPRAFTIYRTTATPGLISGPTNVCEYMVSAANPSGTVAVYTIRKVSSALSYTWTAPANATIIANPGGPGLNDTIVHVIFNSNFTTGAVSVVANNGCGSSTARSLALTRLTPGTPSAFDVIQLTSCPTRTYSYSLSGMPSNATNLVWTVPAGATILSGQGGISITVSYPVTAVSGTVTVTATNNCGTSSTRSLSVKLPVCPIGFSSGTDLISKADGQVNRQEEISAIVFPNPTVDEFTLSVSSFDKNRPATVRVLDLRGRELSRMTILPESVTRFGANLKAGTYLVEIVQGGKRTVQKLIKL